MRTMTRLGCVALCLVPIWALPEQTGSVAPSVEGPKATQTYLVIYRPGPAWIAGKPVSAQPLGEHGRYMLSLYTNRTLKFAGPFTDDAGGAVAFAAESDDAARAVVAADPAVTSRVFVAELHPWGLVDWEQRAKK